MHITNEYCVHKTPRGTNADQSFQVLLIRQKMQFRWITHARKFGSMFGKIKGINNKNK